MEKSGMYQEKAIQHHQNEHVKVEEQCEYYKNINNKLRNEIVTQTQDFQKELSIIQDTIDKERATKMALF